MKAIKTKVCMVLAVITMMGSIFTTGTKVMAAGEDYYTQEKEWEYSGENVDDITNPNEVYGTLDSFGQYASISIANLGDVDPQGFDYIRNQLYILYRLADETTYFRRALQTSVFYEVGQNPGTIDLEASQGYQIVFVKTYDSENFVISDFAKNTFLEFTNEKRDLGVVVYIAYTYEVKYVDIYGNELTQSVTGNGYRGRDLAIEDKYFDGYERVSNTDTQTQLDSSLDGKVIIYREQNDFEIVSNVENNIVYVVYKPVEEEPTTEEPTTEEPTTEETTTEEETTGEVLGEIEEVSTEEVSTEETTTEEETTQKETSVSGNDITTEAPSRSQVLGSMTVVTKEEASTETESRTSQVLGAMVTSVQTGDETSFTLLAGVMALASAVIVVAVALKKKACKK